MDIFSRKGPFYRLSVIDDEWLADTFSDDEIEVDIEQSVRFGGRESHPNEIDLDFTRPSKIDESWSDQQLDSFFSESVSTS